MLAFQTLELLAAPDPLLTVYSDIITGRMSRPEKVDTEKIFQLNNFSKVDTLLADLKQSCTGFME